MNKIDENLTQKQMSDLLISLIQENQKLKQTKQIQATFSSQKNAIIITIKDSSYHASFELTGKNAEKFRDEMINVVDQYYEANPDEI